MDSQTIRTALGTLQAIPDSNEAWTALRDAAKASGGDLSTDELMRLLELEPPDLTPDADARLHELLAQRAIDAESEHERDSAVMMPIILKRARIEAARKTEADRILNEKDVVLVSVPTTIATP